MRKDGYGIVVPMSFDAQAYLGEMMQQLPGNAGLYELSRQLASAAGREEPWGIEYLRNLRAGRQPMSEIIRRALFCHSIGQFIPSKAVISNGIAFN